MRVLRDRAEDGYLDQAMTDGSVRIQVVRLTRYPSLGEQFFRRRLDVRFALSYVREIGLLDVARKARSRRAERVRNDRCVDAGLGQVIESSDPGLVPGRLMSFIVPDSGRRASVTWSRPACSAIRGTWRSLTTCRESGRSCGPTRRNTARR